MLTEMRASPWDVAAASPDRPAIIFADTGEQRSYGQMIGAANRLAHRLAADGLQEGDCLALYMENRTEYLEVVWAAKQLGVYYVCLPSGLTARDAAYILANSGAKALVTSDRIAGSTQALEAASDTIKAAYMAGTPAQGFTGYAEALKGQPDSMVQGRKRGVSMLYSSGTTGQPKGIRHPLVDASPHMAPPRHAYLKPTFGYSGDTVFLNPGPFYHTAPLRLMMHVQREGGTAVAFTRFDAETVLRAIEAHRATHGMFVPTMFVRMLNLPEELRNSVDISSMRCALHGAAPIAPVIKEQMIDWWGDAIIEIYGGTESIGTTLIGAQDWLTHRGSVGRPSAGTRVRIEAPDGRICPPGEIGLVLLTQGKSFEYHDDPGKTAEVTRPGGWATLGDIGYLDREGFLYLTDRASNLIISGGVNIYPQEAENMLAGHPQVLDVAVLGLPDEEFGERVHGLVVLKPGVTGSDERAQELLEFCRAGIGKIKSPRAIEFTDCLPRSEAGKILKKDIKSRYLTGGK